MKTIVSLEQALAAVHMMFPSCTSVQVNNLGDCWVRGPRGQSRLGTSPRSCEAAAFLANLGTAEYQLPFLGIRRQDLIPRLVALGIEDLTPRWQ